MGVVKARVRVRCLKNCELLEMEKIWGADLWKNCDLLIYGKIVRCWFIEKLRGADSWKNCELLIYRKIVSCWFMEKLWAADLWTLIYNRCHFSPPLLQSGGGAVGFLFSFWIYIWFIKHYINLLKTFRHVIFKFGQMYIFVKITYDLLRIF